MGTSTTVFYSCCFGPCYMGDALYFCCLISVILCRYGRFTEIFVGLLVWGLEKLHAKYINSEINISNPTLGCVLICIGGWADSTAKAACMIGCTPQLLPFHLIIFRYYGTHVNIYYHLTELDWDGKEPTRLLYGSDHSEYFGSIIMLHCKQGTRRIFRHMHGTG